MTLVGLLIFLQMCSCLYMFFGMIVSRDRISHHMIIIIIMIYSLIFCNSLDATP